MIIGGRQSGGSGGRRGRHRVVKGGAGRRRIGGRESGGPDGRVRRLEFGVPGARQVGQRRDFRSQRDALGHFEPGAVADLVATRVLVDGDGAALAAQDRLVGQRFGANVARLGIRMANGHKLVRLLQFALVLFLVLVLLN